jgi:ABC-type cobalamin/Fe3+-siderophores transport system ATPase subunit
VRTLSAGELQRVHLARTLAQGSPLLLLDEPTSGLDLAHRLAVGELARSLAEDEGRGVLLVTHDLEVAVASCRRAAVLERGRLVVAGDLGEVVRSGRLADAYGVHLHVDAHPGTGRPRLTAERRSNA